MLPEATNLSRLSQNQGLDLTYWDFRHEFSWAYKLTYIMYSMLRSWKQNATIGLFKSMNLLALPGVLWEKKNA